MLLATVGFGVLGAVVVGGSIAFAAIGAGAADDAREPAPWQSALATPEPGRESEHGTIDGSALDPAGVAVPPIIGIALDGRAVDAIGDTEGGVLDGDTEWDRAVGPMQFIPSTWSTHGVDGDGDGRADPQNIDDAVLTAAYYLCDTGGNLSDPSAWIAAVAAYNSSIEYNNRVAAVADAYARVG